MGHASNLHEGQEVTLVVTSLILIGLEKKYYTASHWLLLHVFLII